MKKNILKKEDIKYIGVNLEELKMRKLTQKEINSECVFIKKNLEYENLKVSTDTMKSCEEILNGSIKADVVMNNIRKKYKQNGGKNLL